MADPLTPAEDARRRLAEARARFQDSLSVARRELTPELVTRRASDGFRRRAISIARKRPALTTIIAATLLAYVFRKPLAGLIRRLSREK